MTVFFSIHTNWPKIVLKKFYEILWSQIESFGLANWTKKVFFFRLTYNTGKDWRVPLSVFPALWIFFPIFFLPKGPPPFFLNVLRQHRCWKNPKGPPFTFFPALWEFFRIFFLPKRSPLQFFRCLTTMDVKKFGPPACQFDPTFVL